MGKYQGLIQDLNKYMDEESSVYAPFHMKMLGTYTEPCQRLDIEDEDKIMYIDLVADQEKLRGIHVHLASGEKQSWGNTVYTDESREKRHDLSDKIDLLGFNAFVKGTPTGSHDDYIVALGLIQNDCPTRDVVDYEVNFVIPDRKGKEREQEERRVGGGDKSIAIAILVTIVVFVTLISIYCCLKNRGQLCNDKSSKKPA